MRVKGLLFALVVIQIVIQPALSLSPEQLSTINQLANATNISNTTLINLFLSLNTNTTLIENHTANITCDFSNIVNRTELVDFYFTSNDTLAIVKDIEESVDDRFLRFSEYYIKQEDFNKSMGEVREQLHNDTYILNSNILDLARNTDTKFNLIFYALVPITGAIAYIIYGYRKKVINVSTDIKSMLPEVSYQKSSIDELDSSKGFIDRVKGITAIKAKILAMKKPENIRLELLEKVNQGIITKEDEIDSEARILEAEHGINRSQVSKRDDKKDRRTKRG